MHVDLPCFDALNQPKIKCFALNTSSSRLSTHREPADCLPSAQFKMNLRRSGLFEPRPMPPTTLLRVETVLLVLDKANNVLNRLHHFSRPYPYCARAGLCGLACEHSRCGNWRPSCFPIKSFEDLDGQAGEPITAPSEPNLQTILKIHDSATNDQLSKKSAAEAIQSPPLLAENDESRSCWPPDKSGNSSSERPE